MLRGIDIAEVLDAIKEPSQPDRACRPVRRARLFRAHLLDGLPALIGRTDVPTASTAGRFHLLLDRPQCRRQRLHRRRGALPHHSAWGLNAIDVAKVCFRRPHLLAWQRRCSGRHRRTSRANIDQLPVWLNAPPPSSPSWRWRHGLVWSNRACRPRPPTVTLPGGGLTLPQIATGIADPASRAAMKVLTPMSPTGFVTVAGSSSRQRCSACQPPPAARSLTPPCWSGLADGPRGPARHAAVPRAHYITPFVILYFADASRGYCRHGRSGSGWPRPRPGRTETRSRLCARAQRRQRLATTKGVFE